MAKAVKAIPDGYHALTPYLYVHDAAGAMAFYKKAFGARELFRMEGPGGKVGHAEMSVGDSRLMLADEHPAMGVHSPRTLGGAGFSMLLYVEDVDAVVNRAVEAGASLVRPVEDRFYGDRTGTLEDPFGHQWTVATHVEDVAPEELERRARAAEKGGP